MNQCLRCNQSCYAPAIFCEQCHLYLETHGREWSLAWSNARGQGTVDHASVNIPRPPLSIHEEKAFRGNDDVSSLSLAVNHIAISAEFMSLVEISGMTQENKHAEKTVSPLAVGDPITPDEEMNQGENLQEEIRTVNSEQVDKDVTEAENEDPNIYITYSNIIEHSLSRLNEAARRIAEDPESVSSSRPPHPSRLAPMNDISFDVRKGRPSLPETAYSTEPGVRNILSNDHTDLWPWLQEEEEDSEQDAWIKYSDPLSSRHIPTSQDGDWVEDDNIQRASSGGISTVIMSVRGSRKWTHKLIFFVLLGIAIILVLDLVMFSFLQHRTPLLSTHLPPSLTLSSSNAKYGQHIILRLQNFTPLASALISRDIQEQVKLDMTTPIVQVNANGAKDIGMVIDPKWNPGFHTIVAEDIQTRYTASITIHVDEGPTRPAHLLINPSSIELSDGLQGSNTIQPLKMYNDGSSTINWSASSDQPWLLVSPKNGMLSGEQTIQIDGDRANLKPGDYTGIITFSSNVGDNQTISVHMKVSPIPSGAGAVISVNPALLSFSATDGGADPADQTIALSNPGNQPLHWNFGDGHAALSSGDSVYLTAMQQSAFTPQPFPSSGVVMPGSTTVIRIHAPSYNLLTGTYLSSLQLRTSAGYRALNSPQLISVSLTVVPPCGVTLNSGNMTFTAVAGQASPSNQSLSLLPTSSCSGTSVAWSSVSTVHWLSLTPASGQLASGISSITAVSVNTVGMTPGVYTGNIVVSVAQNTQSLAVQLTIQSPPTPAAPVMKASPLNLSFSTTLGQPDPPKQTVTIVNTGGSTLTWHTSSAQLASGWLVASPANGQIQPDQTGSVDITVSANGLTPGSYAGQIILNGSDNNGNAASGSPQTISIIFTVLAPCTLAPPSSSSLAFNSIQGAVDPQPQQLILTATGNCSWPINWKANTGSGGSWLHLSPSSGTLSAVGQTATITISPNGPGLSPNTYSTQITLSASDSNNVVTQGSPQLVSTKYVVQQPCTLQTSLTSMSFSAQQGSATTAQTVSVSSAGGNCSYPISWSASTGATWLNITSTSGSDTGSGAVFSVSADASQLSVGSYSATISLSASGSGGATVQGTPQITVTFTVSAPSPASYTISGIVMACNTMTSCASSKKALSGASLVLTDGNGNVVKNATADANGNFSISGVISGTYTLQATGNDRAQVAYQGSKAMIISSNQSAVEVDVGAMSSTPTASTPVSS